MTAAETDSERPLWRRDADRWTDRRQQYLARAYDIDDAVAKALAWHELGYTAAGVAEHVDVTEPTVRSYFEAVADEYGDAAILCRRSDELGVDAPLQAGGRE
jgi:hypothetical protein